MEPVRVVPGQVEWGRAQWPREFPEWVARADLCPVDFRGVPREPVALVALVPVELVRGEWGRGGCVPVAWGRAAWDRVACVPVEWGQVALGQVVGRV